MSERMSVNVETLGINTTHNFMVPNDMNVSQIISLVLRILTAEYVGAVHNEMSEHMLIQANTGKLLTLNKSLSQLEIVNGEKLILI